MAEICARDPSPRALAHTPLCISNGKHIVINFRATDALTWAVAELCLNVLLLDAHTSKAPTALIFYYLYPHQTAFRAFSGLPSWLETTKFLVSKGSTTRITHALSWTQQCNKDAIEAQNSVPRPIAIRRVQACYALTLRRGKV